MFTYDLLYTVVDYKASLMIAVLVVGDSSDQIEKF